MCDVDQLGVGAGDGRKVLTRDSVDHFQAMDQVGLIGLDLFEELLEMEFAHEEIHIRISIVQMVVDIFSLDFAGWGFLRRGRSLFWGRHYKESCLEVCFGEELIGYRYHHVL